MELTDKNFTKGGFGCTKGTPLIAIRMDADFNQVKRDIIQALAFKERCAKDGVLTYDRECNELKREIKSLFNQYDVAFKKHKDIDDFKIAQVLSTLINKDN